MAPRDWSTDCRTLFNNHPCKILSTAATVLFGVLVWFGTRIDRQMTEVQETLVEIQITVGRPGVGPPLPAPRGGIAMVEAE